MQSIPLFLALIFAAQNPSADFLVEHVGDDRPIGALIHLSDVGMVKLKDGSTISGAHIVAIRRVGAPPRRPHDQPRILLANGDCLPGKVLSIQNDRLRLAADLGAAVKMTIPLTSVSAICFSPRTRVQTESKLRHDVVRWTNGDSITGTIVSMAADGPLRIESGGQTTDVPRDRIESISFSSELTRVPKPRERYWRIVLKNGARLSLASATADSLTMTGKTLFDESVRFPMAELSAMSVINGPAAYLSQLKPLRYEHTPYLGVRWPLVNDRSVAGNELRLAGGTFDNGIGLHSASVVTYALPPNVKRFEALAGLDEETGRRGTVLLDMRVDGRSLLSKPLPLNGRDPPHELRLRLPSGGKELTIVVEFGSGGDVQDHVNLADARLIIGPH